MVTKVGVLIHGCHLQADEWDSIMFGKGDRLGRVQTGVMEAEENDAVLIFWGTGASSKEVNGTLMKESEYIYDRALGPELEDLASRVGKTSADFYSHMKNVSFVDTESQDTKQEIKRAIEECEKRAVKKLILVSSPTHIARCVQVASQLKEEGHLPIRIYATFSDTCFANSKPSDVVVVEPPHRGDQPKPSVPLHETAAKIFKLKGKLLDEYSKAWAALTNQYLDLQRSVENPPPVEFLLT